MVMDKTNLFLGLLEQSYENLVFRMIEKSNSNMTNVSDFVANFLRENNVDTAFAITGAGNIRLLESANKAGIRYVCTHHEQAAVMSALSYFRISGKPAVCFVTGGPGAANTLIGLANAYLDSLPCIIIAGQEKSVYMDSSNSLRGKGVQGLPMTEIVSSITKYAVCLKNPYEIFSIMQEAFFQANEGRPGPVWVEIPQDLQWSNLELNQLKPFKYPQNLKLQKENLEKDVESTFDLILQSKRPLVWIGHGVRLSKSEKSLETLLNKLGIPILVSWQAADLIPEDYSLYVGRAGIYGQRGANLALQNCDLLITLGTRLAIPQRGYDDTQFAREAKKVIVEIDPFEMKKFQFNVDLPIIADVKDFIEIFLKYLSDKTRVALIEAKFENWLLKCQDWRERYPMYRSANSDIQADEAGVNSYWFIEQLSNSLNSDDIVVTDMGTSLTCTHATIKIKNGQRLVTSTGLGEMGFGLPGAIGASIAAPDKRVVLLVGEGSFMFNIQELQTLKHLDLPIKIFLLNNNGYLTIKHTHNALFESNGNATATGPETGVSFPNFERVATAFGLQFHRLDTEEDVSSELLRILEDKNALIIEVVMPEFQELIPKSSIKRLPDGSVYSPPLEDMYPFLTREVLAREMIIPLVE